MKKISYLYILLAAALLSSCGKGKNVKNNNGDTTVISPSKTGSTLDLIKDSVYLYAAEDNLWNTALPSYNTFRPRTSYTNAEDATALTNELDALSQYAINPSTGQPYEYYSPNPGQAKYSFIDDGTETAALNGTKGDFGFDVQYNLVNDLRVQFVYPNSPAAMAGIKRGYRITAINSRTAISYDATGYGTGTSVNLNYVTNAIYNSGSITLTMLTPTGATATATFNTANYAVVPVLKDTVFDLGGGHKLGYIVFNTFTSDANADPYLNGAFANFATQGVTDVAVDLRYNGGGYVSTAEHLDNLIVPTSKSGSLMYNTFYNSNLVSGKDPLLKNQWRKNDDGTDYNYGQFDYSVSANAVNFAKSGTLNVSRVFFIISGQTASASELTINNLRPVMDVQFVGQQSYGKPVGFFDIQINKYIMYTPEFSVQNSANQGGYYAGFTPGDSGYPGVNDLDDLTHDWGDPNEGLLAHVLSYVKTGTYAVQKPVVQSLSASQQSFSALQANTMAMRKNLTRFTGMVHNTKKMKLKK